jgi:hypothetical protein
MRCGHDRVDVSERSGERLLALPVQLHGIELGRPVDLLLERDTFQTVGLDVLCGDDVHRFLPLPTAVLGDWKLTIHSPLVLLEEDELDFYRSRTFALSSLRGRAVSSSGGVAGTLRDVVVAPDGKLIAVVLESGERLPFDPTLRFVPQSRSAA